MAELEFSRPAAALRELGDAARDDGDFVDKRVLLTGVAPFVTTANGIWMAEDCLRLMVRTWRRVTVYLPAEAVGVTSTLKAVAEQVAFAMPVTFVDTPPAYEAFDGILSVGGNARADLRWTAINSNGWLARVSSTGKRISESCTDSNPIGAMAAASLGVADLFKRTALKPGNFDLFDGLTFSAFDFTVGGEDAGPGLPQRLAMPPALFLGQGAIGNANVLLGGQLPLHGKALLFDKDAYGPENLGTCVLIGRNASDHGIAKAVWNRDHLSAVGSSLDAHPLRGDIERDLQAVEPYLELVINGLDRVEPRHAIQDAWPDVIVDGALRRFQCQFVSYDHGAGYGCLRCLFERPPARNPLEVQAEMTGLPIELIAADQEITEDHVAAAPEDKKDFLKSQLGKKAHAVACARAIEMKEMFADSVKDDFAPSVPFVATMTAVLVMAEVVRRLMDLASVARRFQFDVLVGPQRGLKINEKAKSSCRCQKRKGPIENLREARTARFR